MAKATILIVEDEPITARNISRQLENTGYKVSGIATSGAEAIHKATQEPPDLVLIDVQLKGEIDGIETAKQIRNQFDIPLVYLTAQSDHENLQPTVQTEPAGCLLKPFAKLTLNIAIETALHKHWTERAFQESEADLQALLTRGLQDYILIDRNRNIRTFNRSAYETIKLISGKSIGPGSPAHELVSAEERETFENDIDKVLQGETINILKSARSQDKEQWFEFHYSPVFSRDHQIIGICITSVDVDELRKTAEELAFSERRLLTELQSILFTTAALVSDTDVSNLLDFITTQARYLTNTDGSAVLLLSDDKDNLRVVNSSSLNSNVTVGSQLLIKDSIAEFVLRTGQTCISNRAENDGQTQTLRKLLYPSTVHSLLCAPLKVRNEMLGVLLVWSKNINTFSERDTPLIHLFANQAALALYNANLHIQNRELAIERERHRLARELHDSVTQSLYSIGMAAQAATRYINQDANDKIKESVEYIHALSQTALIEIRRNLHDLHPTVSEDKHIGKALEQYCSTLEKQYELRVKLRIDSDVQLTEYQRENLYYIAKEALWNVVKHARTNRTEVVLKKDSDEVVLIVEDRGAGFIAPSSDNVTSVGLRTIRERAELLGGSFTLHAKPGWGTRVNIRIPLR